jgi:hypothetical protein
MDIRVVREFMVKNPEELLCKKDKIQLLPNLRHDNTIYLYCLQCSDTIDLGLGSYDRIKADINKNIR